MSRFARENAVYALTPATDFGGGDLTTNKKGFLVTIAGDVATLSASTSVQAKGVILDVEDTSGKAAVGILGANIGPVFMRAGGAIAKGDRVQQSNDGRVLTDAGSGNARVVVGIAMEATVTGAGDLIEVATFVPISLT